MLLLIIKGWGNTGLASMVHPRVLVAIGICHLKKQGTETELQSHSRKRFSLARAFWLGLEDHGTGDFS